MEMPPDVVGYGVTGMVLWKAASLAERALGPPADAAGQVVADYIRLRGELALERVREAHRMVQSTGRTIRDIPPKLLEPLIEGASQEDDSELHVLWSALIANAILTDSENVVHPRYPYILRQLTRPEAVLLAYLHDHHGDLQPHEGYELTHWREWFATPKELQKVIGGAEATVELFASTLAGLALVKPEPTLRIYVDRKIATGKQECATPSDGNGLRLTELGMRFIRACQPPSLL